MMTGFNFVRKTTIEKLKKYSKNPNTLKSAFFWLNVNKIEENEPEKLKNTLLVTDQAKVKKKEQKWLQSHANHDSYTFQAFKGYKDTSFP